MALTAFYLKVQDDFAAEDMVIIATKGITELNLKYKVDFGCSNECYYYYLANY